MWREFQNHMLCVLGKLRRKYQAKSWFESVGWGSDGSKKILFVWRKRNIKTAKLPHRFEEEQFEGYDVLIATNPE